MKIGDIVRFHDDDELGFVLHDLDDCVIVVWSKLNDRSTEYKNALKIVCD